MRGMHQQSRGFSLIEVLISVVVLALGLLGLAAVFPAVVNQQRQASDVAQGVSVDRSAFSYMEGAAGFRQRSVIGQDPSSNPTARRGWDVLIADNSWSRDGEWILPVVNPNPLALGGGLAIDPDTGLMALGSQSSHVVPLPMVERLSPRPYSTGAQPRFVWDMAVRRVRRGDPTKSQDDAVQIAIFVRRIDSGIRRPAGKTLADVLVGLPAEIAPSDRRVPVAADAQQRPTNDGRGLPNANNYSLVQRLRYDFSAATEPGARWSYDRLVLDASPMAPYAAQLGQKMIDQLGVVHTVIEVVSAARDPNGRGYVRVEPAVSASMEDVRNEQGDVLEMLMTPQIPASVSVYEIQR